MRLIYDPRHNIAYLRLQEKTSRVETIHVSESLNVDLAPDGTAYGMLLLFPKQKSTTTLQTWQSGSLSLELCICCRAMTMTLTVIPQTLPRFYSARVAISKGAVARRR